MLEICFVCTGNTCRSVMAERIAKKMAKQQGLKNVKFSSAGLFAKHENISQNAALVLKQMGYDGRNRKSVQLKKLKPNTIYVAVTNNHKAKINSDKCISFEELAGGVGDPYGQSLQVYEKCALEIEKNVKVLLQRLINLNKQSA